MKKGVRLLYVLLFAVGICLPQLFWFFLSGVVDTENHEKRELAQRPDLTLSGYASFPERYEAYFNDHLPFRNQLIELNACIDYSVFHQSSNDQVLLGKDHWLFYDNREDGDPVSAYLGRNLFSEEQLESIAENCLATRDYLAGLGTEFVLFIPPNKERVYAEMMPSSFGPPAERYAAQQLVDYLRQNTDLRVVYPYDALMRVKAEMPDTPLYFLTDTHWNHVGAYVGVRLLLQELGVSLPDILGEELSIAEAPAESGDLAAMLNLSGYLERVERNYAVEGLEPHGVAVDAYDPNSAVVCHSDSPDRRKVFVFMDSFGWNMIDYIAPQFGESYFRDKSAYAPDDLLEQKPDLFVCEIVERRIGMLQNYRFF